VTTPSSQCVAWRRHLHAHPELSFHEHETARFVEQTLKSFGRIDVERPTATSVVGHLRTGRAGPRLALRADIDALPIQERSGVEFASQNDGVMHACGHDCHTAMLLTIASTLAGRADSLRGEVRFVFQHAEETPPGGAIELVEAGALDGVDAVFGMHIWSPLEVGKIGVVEGPLTAAVDSFHATVRGRGGHAAWPHETVDPIAIAAQAISNLQHVVSRNTPALDGVVVSVTRLSAGTTTNVIPDDAELWGTIRTHRPELRRSTRDAISRVLQGIAAAHEATCEVEYIDGYEAVVNDPELTAIVREAAGPGRLVDFEPLMGSEDFSAYRRAAPGCFFFVGAGGPDAFPHHHSKFRVDERGMDAGIEVMLSAALRFLNGREDEPA
jgi:amidohydrolase